jgi:hypothetical protein
MEINYTTYKDYLNALEGAKKIVAQKFAIADAKIRAAKLSGELVSDEIYEEYLTWQLLSALVRTQELLYSADDLIDDEDEDE